MTALLDNRFAPLTYSIGFLEGDLRQVADEAVAWQRSLFSQVEVVDIASPLDEALCKLEPLVTPPRKRLLLGTGSPWVACFDNGAGGGDPTPFVRHMCRRIACRGVAITHIPSRSHGDARAGAESSAVRFELYAPEAREWLNLDRSISVVNDYGKWTFKLNGSEQSFETPERYQAKAVKARFTPEMLKHYCAALGIKPFDAEFYGPAGVLVEIEDPLPTEFVAMSLAEARSKLRLGSD